MAFANIVPTLCAASIGTPRLCLSIGELLPQPQAQAIGALAERFVQDDYCKQVACDFLSTPPRTFFDQAGIGGGGTIGFADWVVAHNGLTGSQEAALRAAMGKRRPDIASHLPGVGGREFYDVKANSVPGRRDGRKHLSQIEGALALTGAGYRRGLAYLPTSRIHVLSSSAFGLRGDVFLELEWLQPGLIVHTWCLEGPIVLLVPALGVVTISLLLFGGLAAGGGVVVPVPAL